MQKSLNDLKINIYADLANYQDIVDLTQNPYVKGFTTNPTLMKQAGIEDYEEFAKKTLEKISNYPISFEVFSDEFSEMKEQALKIRSWGENIFVKIPITNSRGESSIPLIRELSDEGVKLNVTAILSSKQIRETIDTLEKSEEAIVSIFAGRIADTGRDPMPIMRGSKEYLGNDTRIKILWASSRELLNIFQAEECQSDIITVTPSILSKLTKVGMDLDELSLDTVKMFKNDADKAGYKI